MDIDLLKSTLQQAEEAAGVVSERFQVKAFEVAAGLLVSEEHGTREQRMVPRSNEVGDETLPGTITELFALLARRSHPDRVEALAYFSLRRDGVDGITTDYIKTGYSEGRVRMPANVFDVIAGAVKRGHLMDGERRDGQKTWRLTATGEAYIAELITELAGR